MEDGNELPERKFNRRQRKQNAKRVAQQKALDSVLGATPNYRPTKNPPMYGWLKRRPDSDSHLVKELAWRRRYGFISFVDLENLKEDKDLAIARNKTFDVFRMTRMTSAFMDHRFRGRNFMVLETTIVGCWNYYFGQGYVVPNLKEMKKMHLFEYVHVYARGRKCCICGTPTLSADHKNRVTVNYERKTDVADSLIEDLVYHAARFNGRPLNVLLITGDGDFAELVEALRVKDIEVYLCRPTRCSTKLRNAVKQGQQFDLRDVIEFTQPQTQEN